MRRLCSRAGQIIYGPIFSRRIGVDIGINLLVQPGKTCTYNCVYCQYGPTENLISHPDEIDYWVDLNNVSEVLKSALEIMVSENERLDSITFSGYGEPTLHPHFDKAVSIVKKIRDEYYPETPVTVLTNSSLVSVEKVKRGLLKADWIIAKLDVGDYESWKKINRPASGLPGFNEIVEGLKEISRIARDKLTIQTLILDGRVSNASLDNLKSIANIIGDINPKSVQLYTIVRAPAESYVKPVSKSILNKLQNFILHVNREINVGVY